MLGPHTPWTFVGEGALYAVLFAATAYFYRWHTRRRAAARTSGTPGERSFADTGDLEIAEAGANDGLWSWDRRLDRAHFSSRWKELLGFDPSEIGTSTAEWFSRVHPADTDRLRLELYAHITGETPVFESKHRLRDAAGNYRWVFTRGLAVRDDTGRMCGIGGSLSDLSPFVETEERLASVAMHDELTELPNRAYFMELLERCMARAVRRPEYRFAVLFIDLDRFKAVNDSLGHAVGDELLTAVSRRLEACVRPGDVVARLGGDEFTILLDDIEDASDATRIAQRILATLRQPLALERRETTIGASVGIALNDGQETSSELLRAADLAMYRAKARGRGRYEVFDRAMHGEAVARLRLEADLRNAVARHEFQLFYQPVVEPGTGVIRAVEALMRWNHPTRGMLPADEFITVANETGLIVALGTWMLRESCHQVARWQKMFPASAKLSLSVNFCRRELQNPDLLARIERLLTGSGLQPGTLRIEITESGIAGSQDAALGAFRDLERLGVGFQIDDFGMGNASLILLHRFPVSAVKIDRSLVVDIAENEDSRETVRYMAAVARAVGVEVIAQGVETEEQERCLLELGCCSLAQGYRYSKPVGGVALEEMLRTQHRLAERLAS